MSDLDFHMLFDALDGNGQAASVVERQYMSGMSDRAIREEVDLSQILPKRMNKSLYSGYDKVVLTRKAK